ncbi:MAG: lysophospholipid acyltransferase family protein [Pseudomonadota bacterium]
MINFIVTLALWAWYIMGYLTFFSPFYLYAYCFSKRTEDVCQRLNHRLHRYFFTVVRILIPRVRWHITEEVSSLRSSIIIANHRSFLDPILFVSLYEKQKTIVKKEYFGYPVFGWILKVSGYMPSLTNGRFSDAMLNQVKSMTDYLANGGNLFIFPEGTRSRDGRMGPFDKGAFRIARLCRVPIAVVSIRNTDKLYPPDGLLFNTRGACAIEVELAGRLTPDYDRGNMSIAVLMEEARALLERKMTP